MKYTYIYVYVCLSVPLLLRLDKYLSLSCTYLLSKSDMLINNTLLDVYRPQE